MSKIYITDGDGGVQPFTLFLVSEQTSNPDPSICTYFASSDNTTDTPMMSPSELVERVLRLEEQIYGIKTNKSKPGVIVSTWRE